MTADAAGPGGAASRIVHSRSPQVSVPLRHARIPLRFSAALPWRLAGGERRGLRRPQRHRPDAARAKFGLMKEGEQLGIDLVFQGRSALFAITSHLFLEF